ncbi:MAG: ribosomal protein S18-alanine N-acetyltransferase [Halodesulfurarchaeum sp.]
MTAAESTIRPAERADLYAVVRIENRTFERPWTLASFEEHLGEPGFLVLEDSDAWKLGEELAGYVLAVMLDGTAPRVGHVKDLAVKPALQGEGRGGRLMEAAVSTLREQGALGVRLEVRPSNEPALALYDSLGFERIARHSGYYPDGEDALILARRFDGK